MKARMIRAGLLTLTLCGVLPVPPAPASGAQGRRPDARLIAQAQYYSGDDFRFETRTPRGVRVYAVNRPAPEALRAIDSGLAELFAVARRHGYAARLNYTVYTAGMVLSMEPCAFLIAEHERDFQRISNVARYEGEHIVLYHNDRRLYAQTADHSRGGGHPILQ